MISYIRNILFTRQFQTGRKTAKHERNAPFPTRLLSAGFLVIIGFVTVFSFWSAVAPLEGAVIASGIVNVSSPQKVIQHDEGGSVDSVYVADGDIVKEGQPLIELSSIKDKTILNQLEMKLTEALVTLSRLEAELSGAPELELSDVRLFPNASFSIPKIIDSQQKLLESRLKVYSDQQALWQERVANEKVRLDGLSDRLKAKGDQLDALSEEVNTLQDASRKELIAKTTELRAQQRFAEIVEEYSDFKTKTAQSRKKIVELELEKSKLNAETISNIATEIQQKRALIFDITQQRVAVKHTLERKRIVSPINGRVVNLQVHTNSAVVIPGEPIMTIVPEIDDLVVYALIEPDDIDEVEVGMPATVNLTSITRRNRLPISGEVSSISADTVKDEDRDQFFYQARINLLTNKHDAPGYKIIPGMGAEVFLKTSARSALDYLISPISQSMNLSLREQ